MPGIRRQLSQSVTRYQQTGHILGAVEDRFDDDGADARIGFSHDSAGISAHVGAPHSELCGVYIIALRQTHDGRAKVLGFRGNRE